MKNAKVESKPTKSKLSSKLKLTTNQLPHVVVKALAGTGKTFTMVMGIAHAFLQDYWDEVLERFAKQKGISPKGFAITPSPEQAAVWDELKKSADANAKKIVYCAFNKSIVTEFEQSWGWLVDMLQLKREVHLSFATVNSLGNRTIYSALKGIKIEDWSTESILEKLLGQDLRDWKRFTQGGYVIVQAIKELVALCKLNMIGCVPSGGGWKFDSNLITPSELSKLVDNYTIDIADDDGHSYIDHIFELVPQVLDKASKTGFINSIDFNDQNWLPLVMGLPIPKVDLVLVDESQDLPRCKQEFLLRAGKRIVIVGDTHQAIYGFAGADTNSIPRMQQMLNVKTAMELNETRRCGKAIVAEAAKIVPNFKAHASNHEGKILKAWYCDTDKDGNPIREADGKQRSTYHSLIEDNDMILCRTNGPLVSQAMKLLTMGRKVSIRGRKFGEELVKFVNKFKTSNIQQLVEAIHKWETNELDKEQAKKFPNQNKITQIQDKVESIMAFCQDASTVNDVTNRINLVFAGKQCPLCRKHFAEEVATCPNQFCKKETCPITGYPVGAKLIQPKGILLTSIHRAKGLEADRVFFLMPKGGECPHPMAKTKWQMEQEMNLKYVGITRAIKELVYVYE